SPLDVASLQNAFVATVEQSVSLVHGSPTCFVALIGVHFWPWHVWPAGQAVHAWPPRPHAKATLPGLQKPSWQQPAQDIGPQASQAPLGQVAPAGQTVQAWPWAPQAKASVPRRQVPLKQQPSQFCGLQPLALQLPWAQPSPAGQAAH